MVVSKTDYGCVACLDSSRLLSVVRVVNLSGFLCCVNYISCDQYCMCLWIYPFLITPTFLSNIYVNRDSQQVYLPKSTKRRTTSHLKALNTNPTRGL